jgi:hypothetical protein
MYRHGVFGEDCTDAITISFVQQERGWKRRHEFLRFRFCLLVLWDTITTPC